MNVEVNGKTYCVETLIADNERLRKDVIESAKTNRLVLDKIITDLESLREPTEPHLVDYRYHRNDMLDMVLGVIERYK